MSDITRAHDLAHQIATSELLRLIISEYAHDPDRDSARRKLAALEAAAIDGLRSRRNFPTANDETETYIVEAASQYVTRLFASILHPSDGR